VILHDVYKKIERKIDAIIQRFTVNKFNGLLKALNNEKDKEQNEGMSVLVMIYLGKEKVISLCFSRILSILFERNNMIGINRTKLIFIIGNLVFRIALASLSDKNKGLNYNLINKDNLNNKLLYKMKKVISLEKIEDLFLNRDEMDNFYLGDTLLNIILKECNIFKTDVRGIGENKELILDMTEDYRHKLAISSINITHLPMLVPAKRVEMDGRYFPYYQPEINHIHNSFDTIIKPKYDNKYQTKNEHRVSDVITFLNNVKFKVNKKVFNFVVNE
jgi:hypothetical protein